MFCFLSQNTVTLSGNRKSSQAKASGSSNNNSTRASSSLGSVGVGNAATDKLSFVYPYGASLKVERPACAILSSGPVSYPMNSPIAAVWEGEAVKSSSGDAARGRLVVLGSAEIFGDEWLDKEENAKLCDVLFGWLLSDVDIDFATERMDASEYRRIPNIESLSQDLKPCLQTLDELPKDFTKLFDLTMFKFDVDLIPETIAMYKLLGVPHEPLTLIPPQFECPLPRLTPTVFPPIMREPPPPALDQFDLDEHFAKESLRLAQLTNKCSNGEEDLEYYIAESGDILGVTQDLAFGEKSAKHILFSIFAQIVDYKRQDESKVHAMNKRGQQLLGGVVATPAYDLDDDTVRSKDLSQVEAIPIPIHVNHVDLAPMKESGKASLKVR